MSISGGINLDNKSLKSCMDDLQAAVENTIKVFSKLDEKDIPALFKAFKLLHENSGMLDDIKKVVDALYDRYCYEILPRVLEEAELDSIKMHGRNFILTGRMHCSIPIECREQAFEWLNDHGMDYLIRPQVNSKQLTTAISSYFEENAKLPPEDIIKAHKQKLVVVRKA